MKNHPLLEIEKQLAKQRSLSNLKQNSSSGPNDPIGRTRDIVAQKSGLSSKTLERAKKVIELVIMMF